ncbi:MAG: hypothetical protein ACREDR_42540, partial [Blastocatellia bacterium]
MTKVCPKCDFANEYDANLCLRCGRELALTDPSTQLRQADIDQIERGPTATKLTMVVIVWMMTAGSIIYRVLVHEGLEQTSLLFIGIPAVLAAIVV